MLPLRPEWVTRAFYSHGLVAGGAFVGLCLAGARLSGMPNFIGVGMRTGQPFAWVPYMLMVPSFAGLLASRAAGDHHMRALSGAALILTLPGYLIGMFLPFRVLPFVERGFGLAGLVALILALVGGLPPLVHLLPRKTPGGRRMSCPT